jgi:antitoxin component of MazEF toxin-antitoxin module
MKEPIRFFKRIQKSGNSKAVILPKHWFDMKGNECIIEVMIEVYKDRLVIKPY